MAAPDLSVPLVIAKQQLRSIVKQRLTSLSHDAVLAQSRRIHEALEHLQPYRDAARISVFLSMPSREVQTDAIVRHALSCGKQVFVPYLHKPVADADATPDAPARVMDMVSLADLHDYESLRPDPWGIPSVDPATIKCRRRVLAGAEELHLVLLPGVAFDRDQAGRIRRLGHGKGFYDRFLNTYSATDGRPPPLLYGLALTEQLLSASSAEQVPVDAHDRNLDGLILGTGQVCEASSNC